MNGTRRYRHSPGITCGCTNKSVVCDILEDEFGKLLKLIDVNPERIDLMTEWAIQAQQLSSGNGVGDVERQKNEAIALCRRRIEATVTLFVDGMISKEEYRRVDENEREIAHWEMRTNETEKLGLEFAMCVNAVKTMCSTWETNKPEDKQGMARNLFEAIIFDLDTHRILGFKLKPWADRFLVVRAAMVQNENAPSTKGSKRVMLHTSFDLMGVQRLGDFCRYLTCMLYKSVPLPAKPVTNGTSAKSARNQQIIERHKAGETLVELASEFNISEQRVHQIVNGRRK